MNQSDFNQDYQRVRGRNAKVFSRSDIEVEYCQYPVHWYFDSVEMNRIKLDSEFQRNGGLWSREQKSRFIESLIMNLPITPVFLADNYDERFDIIDGLQRITTICEFFSERSFNLVGLDFYIDLEGLNFHSLTGFTKRSFSQAIIHASILRPGIDPSVKSSIFHRINTSGTTLNEHEIRSSLHLDSYFYKRLLAFSKELTSLGFNISDKRKKHQELILKVISLYSFGWDNFKSSKNMSAFLDNSMYSFTEMENHKIDCIFDKYMKSIELIESTLGGINPYQNFKGVFSNAVYLTLVHTVMLHGESMVHIPIHNYNKLLNDPVFKKFIVNASSKFNAIYGRYEMMLRLIC